SASAENVGFLDSADGRQPRLHQSNQIIRYLVRLKNVRGETEIRRSKPRIRRLDTYDWDFCLWRQVLPDCINLRGNVGQRFVGVVIQLETHGNQRAALGALRLDVIDPIGRGDRAFQWSRDKSAHQFRIRANVNRVDRN